MNTTDTPEAGHRWVLPTAGLMGGPFLLSVDRVEDDKVYFITATGEGSMKVEEWKAMLAAEKAKPWKPGV